MIFAQGAIIFKDCKIPFDRINLDIVPVYPFEDDRDLVGLLQVVRSPFVPLEPLRAWFAPLA